MTAALLWLAVAAGLLLLLYRGMPLAAAALGFAPSLPAHQQVRYDQLVAAAQTDAHPTQAARDALACSQLERDWAQQL